MAANSSIRIEEHPFRSPEAYALVRGLEADLAAFYPDWDQLSSPNHKPDPRPASVPNATDASIDARAPDQTSPNNDPSKTGIFFIAVDGSIPVDCAAQRLLTKTPAAPSFEPPLLPGGLSPQYTYCEIKRMYVVFSHRG